MAERIERAALVYARALHAAAAEAGRVAQVNAELAELAEAIARDDRLLRALLNPSLPDEAKHRIVLSVLREADPLTRNGVLVLLDNGRLSLLSDVAAAFAEMAAEDERVLHVEMTTAIEVDADRIERISNQISEATGLRAQINAQVDPNIIGGLVIRARGVLLDASVKRELDDIRRVMITTPLPVGSEA
jgi:F-type H+-transporting ATPase subunit delta